MEYTMPDFPLTLKNIKPAVIGLGYVGLPLTVELAKKYPVVGFDIDRTRVEQLQRGIDITGEITSDKLSASENYNLTSNTKDLKDINVFIVTVPTPVDNNKIPNFFPIKKATKTLARQLTKGNLVIYESTVYPGATEEVCIPILEEYSDLKFNIDFFVGYSPERINPGDKKRKISDIIKITSGSTPESADFVDELYSSIITAGTHKASSIVVAEAAKVIENTQRDVNIALMNELAVLFDKLNIDTNEVLDAASTKWNFLNFRPGLVGGHCIGVDPYYLAFKAQSVGHHPEVILAGRRINDSMPSYVAEKFILELIRKKIPINEAKILILGFTFKENCPDTRNTKIFQLMEHLTGVGLSVDIYDPIADASSVLKEFKFNLIKVPTKNTYSGIICAVAHDNFKSEDGINVTELVLKKSVIYDLKNIFQTSTSDIRL
tara:strand:- start:1575 stop:2876 length:1302 start_codon:yes stop_codon:yes gene_type:complete